MVFRFSVYIYEQTESIVFNLLHRDEMPITDIVNNKLLDNWNKYSIIELDMFYVFKNNFTNTIFKIDKNEIIVNNLAYKSIRKSKNEN